MGKKKDRFRLKISLMILFIVGALGFLMFDQLNEQVYSDQIRTFEIPTLAFAGATDTNINPSIECNVKHTGYAIDSTGLTIASFNSQLATGNPLLDLTSGGKSMAGYVIQLKMFCANDSGTTLEVQPTTFTMVHHARDSNDNWVKVAQKTFQTSKVFFEDGDGEKTIGFSSVYASEVENKIDDGTTFNSLQEFQTFGNLKVNWQGYSSVTYDVPIPVNSMKSWNVAQITNDNTQDQELADPDGDGIVNKYDDCDNTRETFNGYQDGDGCPDTNPTVDDTQESNDDPIPTNEDPSQQCTSNQTYVDSQGICVDNDVIESNITLDGKMLWQVDVKDNAGGVFAFTPQEDPSPFNFSIPLDITGGKNIGEKKQISEITAQTLLKFDDPQQHKLVDTKSSDINYLVLVGVGDKSNPTWLTVKSVPADDFIPRNGASAEAGMSLGNVIVRASEIEGKISSSLVPIGSFDDLQIKIIASGSAGIIFNDNGELKNLNVNLQESECTEAVDTNNDGFCPNGLKVGETTGDTNFRWTNLVISRGISAPVGDGDSGSLECDVGTENKITNKQTGESFCIKIGTTGNDSNPDPQIGEEGVEICVDDASGVGGFPCTEDYRNVYCNGTTQCGVPEEDSDISGNDGGLFSDDSFIIDNDGSETTSTPVTNGDDVACTTDGLNTLDLTNNPCIITDGSNQDTSSDSSFCIGNNCSASDSSIDLSLIVLSAVLIIAGISVYVYKKNRT
jgi:hypothetical protein